MLPAASAPSVDEAGRVQRPEPSGRKKYPSLVTVARSLTKLRQGQDSKRCPSLWKDPERFLAGGGLTRD